MADSINNFPQDQADDKVIQLRSTLVAYTMADSVDIASLSLLQADQQADSDLIFPPVTGFTADPVIHSSSRDQADHQVLSKLSLTSINCAHNQEHTSEAVTAVAAVLGTTELLLLIIAEVPTYTRARIRRVSVSWRAAVEKIGYTLEPIGYDCWKYQTIPDIPIYLIGKRFRFCHPNLDLISPTGEEMYERAVTDNMHASVILEFSEELSRHKNQFISHPPITQVLICVSEGIYGERKNGQVASLWVQEGIRIRDLIEYFEKLAVEVNDYNRNWVLLGWTRRITASRTGVIDY
jgi:hypothetical protein